MAVPLNSYDDFYRSCRLCRRDCGTNRLAGGQGVCGETSRLRLAVAGLHFGEEPPLVGGGGSGTLFVSGCAMKCPFCQNHQISRGGMGSEVDGGEFRDICFRLADAGAVNINLVTPSHHAPVLTRYLRDARREGLDLPVAWNSSGYESVEALSLASEAVDIWLPDLKTLDDDVARNVYGCPGYPASALEALQFMAGCGGSETNEAGVMTRGLMVRHLVLPDHLESTRHVLEWFASEMSGRARLSLMTQYTPVCVPGENRPIPGRQLDEIEYEIVLGWLDELGIEDGFVQELVPGSEWLPDFRRPNPFSSHLSRILWPQEQSAASGH